VLFNIKDDIQAMNFAIGSKDDGGLELILPGKYYHIMKCHQYRILTEQEDEILFGKLKKEFFIDNREEIDNSSIPKIGYALQSFERINDIGFECLTTV
jgi:hypothetical protein